MGASLVEQFAALPEADRAELLAELSPGEVAALTSWRAQARPEQLPPLGRAGRYAEWTYWALIGGRGSGKTRSAAEWVCDRIEGIGPDGNATGFRAKHVGFIGRTAGDVRRVMVEGESGFIACAERRGMKIVFNPSRAQITVTCADAHEATVTLFSADEPDGLRGPQHDTVWADEFAAWPRKADSMGNTALTNAQAGLRLGDGPGYGDGGQPQGCFTTTPRPTPEVKAIMRDDSGVWAHTHMTTWDNAANLAPGFIDVLQRQYAGTRMALQEFEGILVEDVEGALWMIEWLQQTRVVLGQVRDGIRMTYPQLAHRAVAVDPSIAFKGQGDECGIVSGGVGVDRRMYVTGDWSLSGSPDDWARRAVEAYRATSATVIIAEGNQGHALVSTVIHNVDPSVPVELVMASDGKRARAEPVAQLWNPAQQRAAIIGSLPLLEEQLYGWSALESESPDRLDAMVWLGHWCLQRMFYAPAGFSNRFGNRRLPTGVG